MGVTKLMRFMNRSRYYYVQETNLRQLATDHGKLIEGRPILIVDGLNVIDLMCPEPGRWIYGGQFKLFVQSIKHFIQRIEGLGIEMIFYFDGSVGESMRSPLVDRRKMKLEELSKAFLQIRKGNFDNINVDMKFTPTMPSFARYVLKYECKVNTFNIMEDTHREIARLARDNPRCFGILAKNTEYVIFDTKPLISSYSLNMSTMNVKVYSKQELANATRLDLEQLPILSCMLGNEIISSESLRKFHYSISPNYGSNDINLAFKASNIIQHQKWKGKQEEIPKIAKMLDITETELEKGLSWYNIKQPRDYIESTHITSSKALQLLCDRCIKTIVPSPLYTVMSCHKYDEGVALEDPDDENLPPSALIYRSLRRRMYHVLSEGNKMHVKERCVYGKHDVTLPENIESMEFEFSGQLPSLDVLWSDEVSKEICWDVFVACLGVTISVSELKNIETHHVTMCCLLNHLMHFRGVKLPEWEVKAFISQAVHPRANDLDYISSLKVSEIHPRAVSLTGIFLRGVNNVMFLLGASGLPFPLMETMPWKYFDGKLFHHCYNRLLGKDNCDDVVTKLYENDMDAMNKFKDLYRVTTEGVARAHNVREE